MNSILLLIIINASVFSINGLGEDMSVFNDPFLDVHKLAKIELLIHPEFNILHKGSDMRAFFWTNPFYFRFATPLPFGFAFGIGNQERFNQAFDTYLENNDLKIYLDGAGGVEEVYAKLEKGIGKADIAFQASYLFGNAEEIWNYSIGNYELVDSFMYKYQGMIFSGGLQFNFISLAYEGFGQLDMEKTLGDTSIDLPHKINMKLNPPVLKKQFTLVYEYSFWPDDNLYSSPHRFDLMWRNKRFTLNYTFNPWYLTGVSENGVGISYIMPVQRFGFVILDFQGKWRHKGALSEVNLSPSIKLVIHELFARRR